MPPARTVGLGIFVIGGLLLFATALFMIGDRRLLFTPRFALYAEFGSLNGLQEGATVRVGGMDAGEVQEIQVPRGPGKKFRVRCEVRDDLHPLIRSDSIAAIRTEGLVGGQYLQIVPGTEAGAVVPAGGTVPSREPFDVADVLEQMSRTVGTVNDTILVLRADVEKALGTIADTTADIDQLVQVVGADVHAMSTSGKQVADDARAIVERVRNGEGTVGKLMTDDAVYERVQAIAADAGEVAENLRQASAEARRAIETLNRGEGSKESITSSLRLTLDTARQAVTNLAESTEALKRNWFFRGYFERRGYYNLSLLSSSEYRAGALEKGGRKAYRIWLDASLIFTGSPGGGLQLSPGGRARVESAISQFLQFRNEGPLVVEGYAQAGAPAEQYLASRERARLVREYLLERFGFDEARIGLMPLGADAKGSPADGRWDGVALALFITSPS